jgi:hypothetical protein
MEVNGPATMVMILEQMLEEGRISREDYDVLNRIGLRTIEYMKQYSLNNKVMWHDVKNNK